MLFQPYSPRWLVENGREDEAREVQRRARADDDEAEDELDEIRESAEQEGGVRDLWGTRVRPGLSTGGAIPQALSVGITNVVFTVIAILLLDRVGRRPLLITGIACIVTLAGLGLFFADGSLQHNAAWVALA